jgi:hypothetical protein
MADVPTPMEGVSRAPAGKRAVRPPAAGPPSKRPKRTTVPSKHEVDTMLLEALELPGSTEAARVGGPQHQDACINGNNLLPAGTYVNNTCVKALGNLNMAGELFPELAALAQKGAPVLDIDEEDEVAVANMVKEVVTLYRLRPNDQAYILEGLLLRAKAFFKAASGKKGLDPGKYKEFLTLSEKDVLNEPAKPAKPASGALLAASCGYGKTWIAIFFLWALLSMRAITHGVLLVHHQVIGQFEDVLIRFGLDHVVITSDRLTEVTSEKVHTTDIILVSIGSLAAMKSFYLPGLTYDPTEYEYGPPGVVTAFAEVTKRGGGGEREKSRGVTPEASSFRTHPNIPTHVLPSPPPLPHLFLSPSACTPAPPPSSSTRAASMSPPTSSTASLVKASTASFWRWTRRPRRRTLTPSPSFTRCCGWTRRCPWNASSPSSSFASKATPSTTPCRSSPCPRPTAASTPSTS